MMICGEYKKSHYKNTQLHNKNYSVLSIHGRFHFKKDVISMAFYGFLWLSTNSATCDNIWHGKVRYQLILHGATYIITIYVCSY